MQQSHIYHKENDHVQPCVCLAQTKLKLQIHTDHRDTFLYHAQNLNGSVAGIVNNTIKQQKSSSMEMKYFWLLDQQTQKLFQYSYHPGFENLGDLHTKAHTGKDTQHKRPFYVHTTKSPRFLTRALLPHIRRGCVGTIRDSPSRIATRKLVQTRGGQLRKYLHTYMTYKITNANAGIYISALHQSHNLVISLLLVYQ